MPLLEYCFQRVRKKTSLFHIHEVGDYWITNHPDTTYPGYTAYFVIQGALKNYKQPRSYKVEYWYAYTDKSQECGGLKEAILLLSNPPFDSSTDTSGADIPPVPLPIKKPVGRPRKPKIYLRQIVICQDLQLIAKLKEKK